MADVNNTSLSESSGNESISGEKNACDQPKGNPGLADALTKAIRMGKNKNGKSIVLSKAKLYSPKALTKKSHGFEIEPNPNVEIKEENQVTKIKTASGKEKGKVEDEKPCKDELKKLKITKQEKLKRGRLKPSLLDRDKERPLVKIATKGVVQLFNAVRQHQTAIKKQINKPGITEVKKEKILKAIDKKAFLDVLLEKASNSQISDIKTEDSNVDNVVISSLLKCKLILENPCYLIKKSEPEEEPSWRILRDDFMMGAKLKDWDKKEIEVMEEL